MTILCITAERLPGIRPCTHLGLHRVSCRDHEGWREDLRPGNCRGCLPRKAEVGYLCQGCWQRLNDVMLRWPQFRRLVVETDGRAVSPEVGGKGSAPDGYTNLPLTFLALDECDRLHRSATGITLDAWVHTEAGARDAVMFTHAAQRAYQSLEVEKRELKLERVRCPHCGELSLTQNPTRRKQGVAIVECHWCGELLDKIRDDSDHWVGSETCRSSDPLVHLHCDRVACRCACHELGPTSRETGIAALWNADGHTWAPASTRRDEWVIDGPMTIRRLDADQPERKIA